MRLVSVGTTAGSFNRRAILNRGDFPVEISVMFTAFQFLLRHCKTLGIYNRLKIDQLIFMQIVTSL